MHRQVGLVETVVPGQSGAPDAVLDGQLDMTRRVRFDHKVASAPKEAFIQFPRVDTKIK